MGSHIDKIYDPILLKKLFAHALSIDIESNNDKVDIIKYLIGDDFVELGPGTNRYGVVAKDGFCHKIALDRRGIVDNCTEFKRAQGIEWCSPRVYETNGLILVSEMVELITREEFIANKASVLDICRDLAETFIFEDIGFAAKNFCNWGIRQNGDLVILDTGYLIPKLGNEDAMRCPVCGKRLDYNTSYTKFICTDSRCNTAFTFIDVYRRLTSRVDDELYSAMSGYELPSFEDFNDRMYNAGIMKGGHVHYDEREHDRDHSLYLQHAADGGIVNARDLAEILQADGLL